MVSEAELYTIRAEDEFLLAEKDMLLSTDPKVKIALGIPIGKTFFYSAKALLCFKGIITDAPEEHQKTYAEFEKLVVSGEIDVELLNIYKSMAVRADELLGIFKWEKSKNPFS